MSSAVMAATLPAPRTRATAGRPGRPRYSPHGPVPYPLCGDAGAHPYLGGEPVEKQGVPAGGGEDVDPGTAVAHVHRPGLDRILARRDPAQYMQVGTDVLGERPRGADPVLGRPRGIGAVTLGAGAGRGHVGGAVDDPRHQPLQQRDPFADRGGGPRHGAFAQLGEGLVQRFGVEGRDGHRCAPGAAGVVGRVAADQASGRAASRAGSIRVKAASAPSRSRTPESRTAVW